jgi:deoxynucleoside triphosphate triphosphohydrolase SAMHD1
MGESELGRFQALISEFTRALLLDYIDRLPSRRPLVSKEVNDPVCGTIVIQPAELLLLDSPVLQRLRRIRQLGVVHLAFPGAVHTRFDHSLGIVARVTALIDAVNYSAAQQQLAPAVNPENTQLLRLAALCHDVGHGFMSHVSEKALAGNSRVNALQREFNRTYQVEGPSLAEIASFEMVRSDSFGVLLDAAWRVSGLPRPVVAIQEYISDVIVGKTVSNTTPLLHELVNGPYDGDKLDYLTRDAYFAGVPQVVDIQRLIQKIRVTQKQQRELPDEIANKVPSHPNQFYAITSVLKSGASTLDELALARALLHDKIYRHQKVRAAEAMVASALALMAPLSENPAMLPMLLHDEAFLDLNEDFLRLNCDKVRDDKSVRWRTAVDLAGRLRDRRVFVRAFAWSATPEAVGQQGESEQTEALHMLLLALRRTDERGRIAQDIADAAAEILELLGDRDVLDSFSAVRLKNYIWIDPPAVPKGRGLLNRAYLTTTDGSIQSFGQTYPDTDGWSNQYLVNREVGFVFAPEEIAVAVFLASEQVFRTKHGVRLGEASMLEQRLEDDAIHKARASLAQAGYYDDKPADLLPMPPILKTAGTANAIESFLERARSHMGPVTDSAGNSNLTVAGVRDFLRQFKTPELIQEALSLLNRIEFIGRQDAVSALDAFISRNPEFRGGVLCALGDGKDSSSVYTYMALDKAIASDLTLVSLHELPEGVEHIVMVDDVIGSGRQTVDIIESWLGAERTSDLGEARAALPDNVRERIAGAKLGFVYAAGFRDGQKLLESRLSDLSVDAVVHVHRLDESLPFAFDGGLGESTDTFKAFCQAVGEELLTSGGMAPDKAAERGLGYGARGLLLVSALNTPAQTLTLLWESGSYQGVEWRPLFPRRRKY